MNNSNKNRKKILGSCLPSPSQLNAVQKVSLSIKIVTAITLTYFICLHGNKQENFAKA